ncbi:MAG: hypothetical protein GY711_03395, partial [bacterium]|nr:hypothetical protein [bacterium]
MNAPGRLAHLGGLAGIAQGYHDIRGRWHEPSGHTLRALLGAMGLDVSSDAAVEAAIAARESTAWRRPLPAVHVLRAGEAPRVPLVVPGALDGPVEWTLTGEDGVERAGHARLAELAGIDAREVDGRVLRRLALDLGGPVGSGYHRLE